MTNLLAVIAICIVTNMTMADNSSGCAICAGLPGAFPAILSCHRQPCAPYNAATEKTETTEVVELMTITIDPDQLRALGWAGGLIEGTQKRVLSRTVRRWVRKDNWVEVP